MKAPRSHVWRGRLAATSATLGAGVFVLCVWSVFRFYLYQQPPGMIVASGPAGTTNIMQMAGPIRARLLCGSLIVSNGDLPWPQAGRVSITLGYLSVAGVHAGWNRGRYWTDLVSPPTWKYFFYREH